MPSRTLYFLPDQAIESNIDTGPQIKSQDLVKALAERKVLDAKPLSRQSQITPNSLCYGKYLAGADIEKYVPGFTYANSKQKIYFQVWDYLSELELIGSELLVDNKGNRIYAVLELINADHSLDDLEFLLQVLEELTQIDYKVVIKTH